MTLHPVAEGTSKSVAADEDMRKSQSLRKFGDSECSEFFGTCLRPRRKSAEF